MNPPPHHGIQHHGVATTLRTLLEILVIGIFIATFIAQPAAIPSQSMEPTLRVGDFFLTDKQSFALEGFFHAILPPTQLHRGDIAVFRFPPDPATTLIKRIIALPGDRIHLHNGHVILNGTLLDEPYASYTPTQLVPYRDDFPFLRSIDPNVDPDWWRTLRASVHNGELTIPPNAVFVLGDNRNSSDDSRYWGFVPIDHLLGRPLFVTMTANRHNTFRRIH